MNLSGTVALITGASSGIGRATALQLAQEGAAVALVARRKDRIDELAAAIEDAGGTAYAIPTDISDRRQAEAAVVQTVERYGRLDILVNNAGYMFLGTVADADVHPTVPDCAGYEWRMTGAADVHEVIAWAEAERGGVLPHAPAVPAPERLEHAGPTRCPRSAV